MRFICQSCDNNDQDNMTVVESLLIKDYKIVLCRKCADAGFEPRHIVIIAAFQGFDSALRNVIKKKLYIGEPILLSDVLQ